VSAQTLDYEALAQKHGAVAAAVDYDALAKKHGATAEAPASRWQGMGSDMGVNWEPGKALLPLSGPEGEAFHERVTEQAVKAGQLAMGGGGIEKVGAAAVAAATNPAALARGAQTLASKVPQSPLAADVVGIASPRTANAIRAAQRAAELVRKYGTVEAGPAEASGAPVYRDATLKSRNIPEYAGEGAASSPAPPAPGAPVYRDATLDRRNIPEYAGEGPAPPDQLTKAKAEFSAQAAPPIERPAVVAPKTPLVTGTETAGTSGSAVTVKTSEADLPAKYKLVEADTLLPSHNAENFAPNDKYPTGVQERAYHTSKEAQARIIQQSQNYDPRYTVNTNPDAVNGPPVVTPDGTVLGGNSRTMSTQRLYTRGQGAVYKDYLRENASQFGLQPEAVDAMKKPVLVREVATPPDVDAARRLGSELNKNMTGALGTGEKAVSAGRAITPQTLSNIAGMLDRMGPDSGIRDLLRERGKDVLSLLIKDGAITERERPQFVDTASGGLSEEGKQFAERALLGTVVDNPTLMDRAPKSILHKLGGSLADITSVAPRADDFNLLGAVRESIADHADIAARGSNVATYQEQAGMFGPERNPVVDAVTRKLAQNSKTVRTAFRSFASDANVAQEGQSTLMGMDRPTPERAFNDAFGTKLSAEQYAKGIEALRPKQVAAIVDQAVPEKAANLQTKAQVEFYLKKGDVPAAEKALDGAASKTNPDWGPERAPYRGSTNDIRSEQPEVRQRSRADLLDDRATQQEMNWNLERHGWQAESEARREFIARNSTGMTKGKLIQQGRVATPGAETAGQAPASTDLTGLLEKSLEAAKKAKARR
jgi:hypothetical protein